MSCYQYHTRDNSESAYFLEVWNGAENSGFDTQREDEGSTASSYYAASDAHSPVEFRSAVIQNVQPASLPVNFSNFDFTDGAQDQFRKKKNIIEIKKAVLYNSPREGNGKNHIDDTDLNEDDLIITYNKWSVMISSVPKLPDYYPLERTHVVISLNVMSLELITALVCFLCRKLSLAAEYNQEMASVALTASEGTHFIVKLFLQVGGKSVILECQKLSGDSEIFYSNAFKIMQVSKGLEHVKTIKSEHKRHIASTLSAFEPNGESSRAKKGKSIDCNKDERGMIHEHLEMAADLLEKDRQDANDLGMEIFLHMTDSQSSTVPVLRETSMAILRGFILLDQDDTMEIRVIPLDMEYLFGALFCPISFRYDDEDMNVCAHDSARVIWKRLMAWKILMNAFHACYCCGISLQDLSLGSPYSPWILRNTDLIIAKIVQTLSVAASRPHDAVLAITCLGYLIKLSPRAKFLADDDSVTQAVNQANRVGRCSHAMLEAASAKVQRELFGEHFKNAESSSMENIAY